MTIGVESKGGCPESSFRSTRRRMKNEDDSKRREQTNKEKKKKKANMDATKEKKKIECSVLQSPTTISRAVAHISMRVPTLILISIVLSASSRDGSSSIDASLLLPCLHGVVQE